MIRRLLPVLLLASTATLLRGAVTTLPQITASRTSMTASETVFTGNARLTYGDILLLADQITYDPKNQIAHAIGHVAITRGSERLLADDVTYNLQTRSYTVKNMRVGSDPIYISGSGVEGDPNKIIIHDAIVTFSEPNIFAPTLSAKSVTYIPNDSVSASNARIGVGPILPIPVPLFNQSINDPLFSHMSARIGVSSRLGAYAELGLLAPVTPTVKLGGDFDIYTERGVMFGPAAAYKSSSETTDFHGTFKSGYINDSGDRKLDIVNQAIPANRGYVGWDHYQTIGDQFTLLGKVNYWSDSDILRDFRPREFNEVQTPDNFFEGYRTGDNYVISAFTRFQPNNYEVVQRRLPEIRFDGLPVEVGEGVYHRLNASFAVLEDNSLPAGADTVDRLDAYYGLTRPFTPREWFSFKPVAGARVTYYDQALAGRSDYTRVLGEVGFDSELQGSATYAYKNERWDIDGLRHVVKPYISYRAITDADRGQAYIPPIDRTAFSTYLQPLGLGDRRDIDTLSATNTMRLGVDNTLQTRDKTYGSRNLAELNVAADWRFDRQSPNEARFSAIQSELALTPAKWLRFDSYQNISPETGSLQEWNTGVTFRDANVWTLRLSSDYLRNNPNAPLAFGGPATVVGIQEYNARLSYFLNEVYEAIIDLSYDSRQGRFNQQTFALRQNIRKVWFINYVLSFQEGDTRAGSTGFSVHFELARF